MKNLPNVFFAHSGTPGDQSDWQLLDDHLRQTGELASERANFLGLAQTARLAGEMHDFGKYDPEFSRVLRGENIRVNHSTAGAKQISDRSTPEQRPWAEIPAYAILGHHAGLPDASGNASLRRRIDNFDNPIAPDIIDAVSLDLAPVVEELKGKTRVGASAPFDLSVAGRMLFSCLVDADFRDTEAYYNRLEGRRRDRTWPALPDIVGRLRIAFDETLARFDRNSELNQLRSQILVDIRSQADRPPGLFTLTVPTGGGKTLASMGFALDHAAIHGHRRIIYAIPYTSIIDQTAEIFRDLFGDIVLEHHSAIDVEKPGQERRDKLRLAMEDWAAPIVVTTNVQLFESLFSARPSRCRKLHNIAGSIIVLDEAQCLPRKLLMPVLRIIETLAAHYGCTILFCTATQPAFDSRLLKQGGLALEGRELAPDPLDTSPNALSHCLRRARIVMGGEMDDPALIRALRDTPQGLVIVNSRAHALSLFEAAKAEELEGLIHLTTRQYPAHRRRVIAEIRQRLDPANPQPCRLIATSLIEAGVDLNFPKGWRAEAGLDSLVQAAGRVNREGRRPVEDSTLTVFTAPGRPVPTDLKPMIAAMRSTASRNEDLLSPKAMRDWFEQVYWTAGVERLGQYMVDKFKLAPAGTDFHYRSMAKEFRMIEDTMLPIIVPGDLDGRKQVMCLEIAGITSGVIARALQPFTVQVPDRDRRKLIKNGHAEFAAPGLRSDQFCVLKTASLYREDSGLRWEDAEHLADEQTIL